MLVDGLESDWVVFLLIRLLYATSRFYSSLVVYSRVERAALGSFVPLGLRLIKHLCSYGHLGTVIQNSSIAYILNNRGGIIVLVLVKRLAQVRLSVLLYYVINGPVSLLLCTVDAAFMPCPTVIRDTLVFISCCQVLLKGILGLFVLNGHHLGQSIRCIFSQKLLLLPYINFLLWLLMALFESLSSLG